MNPGFCKDVQATNIIVNPGLAFGTGEHATTKLCLLLLHGCIKGGEDILDYGTGTGILAIAALKVVNCYGKHAEGHTIIICPLQLWFSPFCFFFSFYLGCSCWLLLMCETLNYTGPVLTNCWFSALLVVFSYFHHNKMFRL